MYGWGDDYADWRNPTGYRFSGTPAARKARKKAAQISKQRGGRKYLDRDRPDLALVSPHGKLLTTESPDPLVVAVDVTGSMSSWPYEIFDRLPLLYQTLSQFRPELEVSFVAIGDATCDSYPLQVCDFAKGIGLEDQLNGLYGEGGGGGGARESYELFADFLLHNARAPQAQERPFLILYGDEGFYERVAAAQVRYLIGGDRKKDRISDEVWRALAEAWNIFHLRKPYPGDDQRIHDQWANVLGEERIVRLDGPERAVDLALGLITRGWGHYEDFEQNLAARQPQAVVRELGKRLDRLGA